MEYRNYRATGLLYALLIVILINLYLVVVIYSTKSNLDDVASQIKLSRVLSVGRTIKDVKVWLGNPDSVIKVESQEDKRIYQINVFKSVSSRKRRLNGNEDIWIVLDDRGHIISTYYPDSIQERNAAEKRFKFLESVLKGIDK